jgi:hypothetical protein
MMDPNQRSHQAEKSPMSGQEMDSDRLIVQIWPDLRTLDALSEPYLRLEASVRGSFSPP